MTARALQKQKTHRALIDATARLSAERGFAALSLREVTGAAGVSPTAFYRHFASMNDLAMVLVDEVALTLRRLMRDARRRAADGQVVLTSVATFLEFLQDHPHQFRFLLAERSGSSPVLRGALQAEIELFVNELAEDLQRNPRISEPHLAADTIVAVVFTVGAEALDATPAARAKVAGRLIRQIRLILRGAMTVGA